MNRTSTSKRVRIVVPCAHSNAVVESLRDILAADLAHPIAIGDSSLISESASAYGIPADQLEIVHADDEQEALTTAIRIAREGNADVIMKGHLHTDALLAAILDRSSGLRTERRLSHIYHITGVGPRPWLITDSGVNIAPDATIKREILRNAVNFAHSLGISRPRVAIISATEEPSSRMPSSVEAEEVMKFAQAENLECVAFGPIALDCALSEKAAASKGLKTEVAGHADIFLVPNLETGNALSKFIVHVMGGVAAGFVAGARIPLIVPSRADSSTARVKAVELVALGKHRADGPSRQAAGY
ncbi:phosphate acyltransferase (plasmid) [Nitrobacteraceae bacterium UC4446_H13]